MIQNMIKVFDEAKRQFLLEEIVEQFVSLATNNCGLCVIKIIILRTHKPENRAKIIKKLVENAIELA